MNNIIEKIYPYIQQVVITAIVVVIGMIILKHSESNKIVKVDLVAITTHYTQMMAQNTFGSSANNSQVKKISDAIKANLEPILDKYATIHKVIIVQSQAIVTGNVPDITNEVISELDTKIK